MYYFVKVFSIGEGFHCILTVEQKIKELILTCSSVAAMFTSNRRRHILSVKQKPARCYVIQWFWQKSCCVNNKSWSWSRSCAVLEAVDKRAYTRSFYCTKPGCQLDSPASFFTTIPTCFLLDSTNGTNSRLIITTK